MPMTNIRVFLKTFGVLTVVLMGLAGSAGPQSLASRPCGSAQNPCPPPHPSAPSLQVLFQYNGTGNDHAGASVAVGDVDGDGTADLIIGADGGALGGLTQTTGYVLVLKGPDFSQTIYKIFGPEADAFGGKVAVGDVDGDGKADIIVGAYAGNGGFGYVQVYSGATGSLLYQLNGTVANAGFGSSLAFANVAGTPEILVGAPAPGSQSGSNGYVDLFNGTNGQKLFEWVGPIKLAERGRGVAFANVRGQAATGLLDIVIGDGSGQLGGKLNGKGQVYVYDGSNYSNVLYTFNATGSSEAKAEDNFGFSVAAGDVNGDGKADVIGGAYRGDTYGLNNNGYALVYNGADGALLNQFNGTYNIGEFGFSVASGDVNGDGKADIVAGERWSPGGHVYIYDGPTGALLYMMNAIVDPNFDWLGYSVTTGYIENNGKTNIVAGAPQGDSRASSQGGYVVVYKN
jgi:FG-GAP repeat